MSDKRDLTVDSDHGLTIVREDQLSATRVRETRWAFIGLALYMLLFIGNVELGNWFGVRGWNGHLPRCYILGGLITWRFVAAMRRVAGARGAGWVPVSLLFAPVGHGVTQHLVPWID